MKIEPISTEIYNHLKKYPKTYFFGGELERRLSITHKPSTIARELRRMSEDGIIYKQLERVGRVNAVKYKFK